MASTAVAALTLQPCEEELGVSARCGWADVLEDRSEPAGRKIAIRVVVLRSEAPKGNEHVLMFPGGPGQATPTLIPLAREVYPRVLEKRDVVFISQRGSGEPNAMHCLEDIPASPSLIFGALWNREGMAHCHERALELADPSHYTTADLSFFGRSLYDRTVALLGGVVSVGLHLSVYCAEDVPRLEGVDIQAETRDTFLGRYLVDEYRGACDNWPVDPAPAEWYRSFESRVPTLFISGYYDPSTPDETAEIVRRSLPNSRHIVVRNLSHGAGFTCAKPAVEDFLTRGSLDGFVNPCANGPIQLKVVTEVHRFRSLQTMLTGIGRNVCRIEGAGSKAPAFETATTPNKKQQQQALDLLHYISL